MTPRVKLAAAAVALLLLATFFLAPVVGYTKPLPLPFNEKPHADTICYAEAGVNSSALFISLNITQERLYTSCLQREQYPPYNLTGSASLSYYLTGVGAPPFPSTFQFSQGNLSGLVYFSGDRVTAAYILPQKGATVDPAGTVELLNASTYLDGYGNPFFNATLKNVGSSPISTVGVGVTGLSGPNSQNTTRGGISWTILGLASGGCEAGLDPGATCSVSIRLGALGPGEIHFYVYVIGSVDGRAFFLRQGVTEESPQGVQLNREWMSLFMDGINQARTGPPLKENSTLDRFAAVRFRTASSLPQISDYDFVPDVRSFFGAAGTNASLEELLLYPGTQAPYFFDSELQSAPIHWSAITNPKFTQYGYYVGRAPYYVVSADCPVTELPSQGINITQYFEGMGCRVTPVSSAAWLVLILSP